MENLMPLLLLGLVIWAVYAKVCARSKKIVKWEQSHDTLEDDVLHTFVADAKNDYPAKHPVAKSIWHQLEQSHLN
jgi:hypothetical protein